MEGGLRKGILRNAASGEGNQVEDWDPGTWKTQIKWLKRRFQRTNMRRGSSQHIQY